MARSPSEATNLRVVSADFVALATEARAFPPPIGVEVAFAGRSNVGKSSLLNSLLGRKSLVRTSSTPGCTRGVSFFNARTGDGAVLTMVDLPGYGYAKRSKQERVAWGPLVEQYLVGRPTLAAVVMLVDVRRGVTPDDYDLLTLLGQPARVSRRALRTLVVATKTDKLAVAARRPAIDGIRAASGLSVQPFSIKHRRSHQELWKQIRLAVGLNDRLLSSA